MKYLIYLTLFFNFLFSIGLRALIIPQSAELVASTSTGLASYPELNPANLVKTDQFKTLSINNWLVDVKGTKTSMLFNANKFFDKSYISLETLKTDNIEFRNEIANDDPLGYFGAYWYAVEFSQAINLKKMFNKLNKTYFGYRIKFNLSKLHTSQMYGYMIDLGLTHSFNNKLEASFIIKNLGKEYTKDLHPGKFSVYALGLKYKIPKSYIFCDLYLQDEEFVKKVAFKTDFKIVNIILGMTDSKNYKDTSYGLSIDIKDISIIYGSLNHHNSLLGCPYSIEIRKYLR